MPLLAGAGLLAPAPAFAGSASLRDESERTSLFYVLEYKDSSTQRNDLTVRWAGPSVVVTDPAGVALGAGCVRGEQPGQTTAICGGQDAPVLEAEIGLGPGDDAATVLGDPIAHFTILDGGAGDDRLRGGDAGTRFVGGPGDDRMVGGMASDEFDQRVEAGAGSDTLLGGRDGADLGGDRVSYLGRRRAVRVDLDGRRDDGRRGERDLVGRDIEAIVGGRGDDLLIGNRRANVIEGSGGADTLLGRAGDDQLDAGVYLDSARTRARRLDDDRIEGGVGDDQLTGSAGPNRLAPGPGADRVLGGGVAGRGRDRINARDRDFDYVGCFAGRESLAVDQRDFVGTSAPWQPQDERCERIDRPGRTPAVLLPPQPLALTVRPERGLRFELACPQDAPRPCTGRFILRADGAREGSVRYLVRRGNWRPFRVRVSPELIERLRRGGRPNVRAEIRRSGASTLRSPIQIGGVQAASSSDR